MYLNVYAQVDFNFIMNSGIYKYVIVSLVYFYIQKKTPFSGAKIDAYVVSGYATREVCNDDQCRVNCPLLPGPESEIIDPIGDQPVLGNKYVPKIVPDYKSKFEKMMEQRRVDEEKEKN